MVDYQIADANHMGAAMAPAVADTLCAHLRDTGRSPADYDLIVTGDLGCIGRDILLEPVSYTHLDVYKRQLSLRSMTSWASSR